jgi:hypothetical protein
MFGHLVGSLVGLGFLGLGATLVATARPRWIIVMRRNRKVPASVRWNGAGFLVVGSEWLALTWVAPAYGFILIVVMFFALMGCGLMARYTRGGFKTN